MNLQRLEQEALTRIMKDYPEGIPETHKEQVLLRVTSEVYKTNPILLLLNRTSEIREQLYYTLSESEKETFKEQMKKVKQLEKGIRF